MATEKGKNEVNDKIAKSTSITPLTSKDLLDATANFATKMRPNLDFINQFLESSGMFPDKTDSLSPTELLDECSKKQNKLVVFDFLPIAKVDKVNSFCKKMYGQELFFRTETKLKDTYQQSIKTIEKVNISLHNVKQINIHSVYHYGDYFTVIYECLLTIDDVELEGSNKVNLLNKRKKEFDTVQQALENVIPTELKGIFGRKGHFTSSSLTLPGFIIYDLEEFAYFFDDKKNNNMNMIGSNTLRSKAEYFVYKLSETDKTGEITHDDSKFLGINQELLFSVFGSNLIISQLKEYLQDPTKPIPFRFSMLSFNESLELDFIFEFISKYYLFISLEILLQSVKNIDFSHFLANEDNLLENKTDFLSKKMLLSSLIQQFSMYKQLYIHFNKTNFKFQNEETGVSSVYSSGHRTGSISDYFEDYCTDVLEELDRNFKLLDDARKDISENIQHKEQVNASKMDDLRKDARASKKWMWVGLAIGLISALLAIYQIFFA